MASTHHNRSTGSDSTDTCIFPGPIQRLCSDILAEIFTFCLPDIGNEPWGIDYISTQNAPLLLCSICPSWRSLAISTPRLWRTFRFFYSGSSKSLATDIDSITSGVRTWLDRSIALPLSIRVVLWVRDSESDEATKGRRILEVLSEEISRWESFELQEDGIWVTPPHFDILSILHTLDISSSFVDAIPFTAAPRLKRLGLYSLCPNPTSVSAIPWDQLVELSIEETQPISTVVEVIQCCPRLESLSLRVKGDEDGSLRFNSTTQHDTLRRLQLHRLPYFTAVIDRLTLPALTDLSLLTYCPRREVEANIRCSQLVAFFTRSNCELRQFALYHSGFCPGKLLECLSHRSCQTLTRLVIKGDDYDSSPPVIDRELLIRLTYPDVDDDVSLCPKLSHLELSGYYCSDRSFPDLLGRMIQSRCFGRSQDARLRTLRIWNRYSVSNEDYELLQSAQSNGGLDFKYSYIHK